MYFQAPSTLSWSAWRCIFNPFTASCENTRTLSVPGVPASCEKFPHSSQLNFWSTESIFNQFSVVLKILNALCVCLQYKHPRSMERVIRSDKPVTLLLLLWSHKCDIGAEPRSCIIVTSAVKGLSMYLILVGSFIITTLYFGACVKLYLYATSFKLLGVLSYWELQWGITNILLNK
jgi:hypothetical protein